MSARGHITREYTVWCAERGHKDCPMWVQSSGPLSAAKSYWRRLGWRFTRADGWLCPGCWTAQRIGRKRLSRVRRKKGACR